MTTETNDTIEQYVISGTGPYAFSFRIFDEDDLTVTALDTGEVDPVTLTVNSHFTVAGVNDEDGGTITLINSAETTYAGFTIDIRSNVVVDQPTSIKNQGTFAPAVHEKAFDRLSRQIQDVARKVKQSFRYPDNVNLDAVMSTRGSWLSKYLYVNSSGVIEPASSIGSTALTQTLIGETLYPRTAAEIAAGVTPINYGKWPSPWKDMSRFVSDNTGATDVTAGFIEACKAEKSVIMPEGIYLLNQTSVANQLHLKRSNFELIGTGRNTILYHSGTGVLTGNNAIICISPIDGDISGIHLANFVLRGPTTNSGAAPNSTNRCLGLLIHDGASSHYVTDVLIENVVAEGFEMASMALTALSSTARARIIKFSNCIARNGRQDGFNDFGGATQKLHFVNCIAHDLDGFGHEHAASSLKIEGGEVYSVGQAGIGLEYNATLGANQKNIIQGVCIHDIGTAGSPDASGISLGQSVSPFNTEVTGNSIYRTGGHGIAVNLTPSKITICDNVIEDVGGGGVNKIGIAYGAAATYQDVSRNKIRTTTAGYAMTYGIAFAGAGHATNMIKHNEIQGETTGKISASYPTRVIRGLAGYVSTTSVGNVGAGEDNLMTYSVDSRTLELDLQSIKVVCWGTTAGNANNKQIKLYWGATQLLATGAVASNGRDWRIEATILRRNSTTVTCTATGQFDGAAIQTDYTDNAGQDYTSAITIKCTGEATSDNDIVQYGMTVDYPDGY